MLTLLPDLRKLQAANESFCLATIIHHNGSTPRSTGTRMVVRHDGSIIGTIGGGKLEAEVISNALQVAQDGRCRVIGVQFSGQDAASMDMICGGSVRVLLDWVTPATNDFWEIIYRLDNSETRKNGQWLVTALLANGLVRHEMVSFLGTRDSFGSSFPNLPTSRKPELREESGALMFYEPVFAPETVYLFGAGHVSMAIARLTRMVNFQTVVVDDREEFANAARFPEADEILVCDPIEQVIENRAVGRDDYIVIVTRGHLQDQQVLEQALNTPAGYIGMIGSRRKRDLIYASLRQKGATEEQISRIYSPIGLSIQAETPEEIAVSIVAELIRARAIQQKN
jgi:xanthine dehydrogenase accessory factor